MQGGTVKPHRLHGGTNAKRVRMICRDCEKRYMQNRRLPLEDRKILPRGRYTLKHGHYVRESSWRCPACHSTNVRSDEKNRRTEQDKRDLCTCDGIPFPHNKASTGILGCHFSGKHYDDWTGNDHEQYQIMLETPRSG